MNDNELNAPEEIWLPLSKVIESRDVRFVNDIRYIRADLHDKRIAELMAEIQRQIIDLDAAYDKIDDLQNDCKEWK